jgi:hypothetical protein
MASLKACTVVEQNLNTIAGAQVSSATYAGTNITADLVIRFGRDAPAITLVSTQTGSRLYVALETDNAYHGATVVLKQDCIAPSTSMWNIFNGLPGTGYAVGTEVSTVAASANFVRVFVFDGVAKRWR